MADEVHEQLYRFTGDEESLLRSLRKIEGELTDASRKKYDIRLVLAAKEMRAELATIEKELKEFEASGPHETKIDVIVAKALADVRNLNDELDDLPLNKTITAEVRDNASNSLRNIERDTFSLVGRLDQLDKSFSKGGLDEGPKSIDALGHASRRAALFLRRLPSYVSGVAIAILSSLLPAVLAAIAGITGMVASAGALAASLGATLIPAIGLLTATTTRLTAVMDVFNLLQAAQRANLRAGVSDARRDSVETQSRANAHRQVADAQRAEQRASEDLKSAQEALGEAATAALEEMAQAARDARDALLDLEQAQLSKQQAELNLDKAKLELEEFRDGLGLTGEQFDKTFKKFTDVNFQFDEGALANIFKGTDDKDSQLELRQLILNVRQAKLDEEQATNSLADAEGNLKDARAENIAFMKEGIAHSQSYQAALDAVEQATVTLEDAQRNSSQAMKDQAANMDALAAATTGADSAAAIYRSELEKLSPAERNFLGALRETRKPLRGLAQDLTAPFFNEFASGLRAAPGLIRSVKPELEGLGDAFVDVTKKFKTQLAIDSALGVFRGFINNAADATRSWGGTLLSAYNIVRNLAQAAMPEFLKMSRDISRTFKGWAEGTNNISGVQDALEPGFELLRIVVDAVAQSIRGLFAVFQAGSGPINEFFGWIRDGIKTFADWAQSDDGREQIKKFFEDTLPLVKAVIKLFVRFGVGVLRLVQIFAPFVTTFVKFITLALDAVILLISMAEILATPFKILHAIIQAIIDAVDGIVTSITGFVDNIVAFFHDMVNKVKDFLGISSPSKVFIDIGIACVKGFVAGIVATAKFLATAWLKLAGKLLGLARDLIDKFFNIGGKIIHALVDGVKAAVHAVVEAFKTVWQRIKAFWEDRFNDAKHIGKTIGNAIADGFSAGVHGIVGAAKAILNEAIGLINDFFIKGINVVLKPRKVLGHTVFPGVHIPEIPKLAAGALVTGPTAAVIGEGRHKEAVLPLSSSVLKRLGKAISSAMPSPSFSPALAGGATSVQGKAVASIGHSVIEHVDVHLPAPPAGGVPDPRYSAAQFAREIKRRGW